jgi:hypothetical protein
MTYYGLSKKETKPLKTSKDQAHRVFMFEPKKLIGV